MRAGARLPLWEEDQTNIFHSLFIRIRKFNNTLVGTGEQAYLYIAGGREK